MAALIKHVLSKVYSEYSIANCMKHNVHKLPAFQENTFTPLITQCRNKFRRALPRKKVWLNPHQPGTKVESVITGMAARGFLRQLKDYDPPADVAERCGDICSRLLGPDTADSTPLTEPLARFNVLNECFKHFNHSVPNSFLHIITTVGELKKFYLTPVSTTTPLEKMKNMDLPENLHVQYEPIRFHPETDTMFGGQSAYPKNNILVTGLRTRKKYKSYIDPEVYCRE